MSDLCYLLLMIFSFVVMCFSLYMANQQDSGVDIDTIEKMNKSKFKKHLSKKVEIRTKTYYYLFKEDAEEFVKNYTRDFINYFDYKLINVEYDYDLHTYWDYDTKVQHIFNGTCITPIHHKYNFRNPRSYKDKKVIITYETIPNYNKYFNIFGFAKCKLPFQK